MFCFKDRSFGRRWVGVSSLWRRIKKLRLEAQI